MKSDREEKPKDERKACEFAHSAAKNSGSPPRSDIDPHLLNSWMLSVWVQTKRHSVRIFFGGGGWFETKRQSVRVFLHTICQSVTRHLYFIYHKIYTCQGDMFRTYYVILRPCKKTDPRCLLGGPEDDLIRSKHVAVTSILFYGIWNTPESVSLEGLRMTL